MKQFTILLCFIVAILNLTVSSIAEENKIKKNSVLTPVVLNKLSRPEDTEFETEAKKLIAEYLVAVATQNDIDATKSKDTLSTAVVDDVIEKGRQESITSAPAPEAVTAAAATAAPEVATSAPVAAQAATQAPSAAATQAPVTGLGTTSRPRPSDAHILGQVDKILQNVYQGNVSGIIDQSLGIRNNTPVRNLVNGIIGLVLCYPWDRLLGRCPGQQSSALG